MWVYDVVVPSPALTAWGLLPTGQAGGDHAGRAGMNGLGARVLPPPQLCVWQGSNGGSFHCRYIPLSSERPEAKPEVLRDSGQSCCSDLQPSLDSGSVCRMNFDLHWLPLINSPGSQEGQ